MNNTNRLLTIAGVVLGVLLIAAAIMYWTVPPKSLPVPSFLGHQSGVSAVHVKHGIACLLLGLSCLGFAWFQAGPKKRTTAAP